MTRNKLRKLALTVITVLVLGCINIATTAYASPYINLGTLDVKALNSSSDYLNTYLSPGEKSQQQIQISNFSSAPKQLILYTTETSSQESFGFYTKNLNEKREGPSSWIDLPVNELTLQPGESRVLSVNFNIPKNAGVGLHKGAVIVREINRTDAGAPDQIISVEKGVRIYLNVTGPIMKKGKLNKATATETGSEYSVNLSIANEGTTNFKKKYELKLQNIFGETLLKTETLTSTSPGTEETSTLSLPKPGFGLYQIVLADSLNKTESTMKTILFVPLWLVISILLAIVGLAAYQNRQPFLTACSLKLNPENLSARLKSGFRSPEFQRTAAYMVLLSVALTGTLSFIGFEPGQLKSQVITSNPKCAYDLTVKWGDFRKLSPPAEYVKEWNGRFYFPDAKVTISDYLHFEKSDQTEIMGDKSVMQFKLQTGPDNDGIILEVEPTTNGTPTVIYENFDNGEEVRFLITDFLHSPGVYPDGLSGTYLKTDLCEEEKLRNRVLELSALEELTATPELFATPEIEATPPAGVHIPELENLFIEELPATPDALSSFVLQSDYVEKISRQNSTNKIETDNILLKAFEASPDILEEIAATPDLNFVFIPAETINFPPLEFSFTEERVIRQKMGTLIFVQNKEDPWNAFVGTTDFQLLSGDLRIPASALSIDPGEPVILGKYEVKEVPEQAPGTLPSGSEPGVQGAGLAGEDSELAGPQSRIDVAERKLQIDQATIDKIQAGEMRTFSGRFDKATLVDVQGTEGEKIIFALQPVLEVRIPAGMPAGTYQGELTITSL